jgi:hypothetical protein
VAGTNRYTKEQVIAAIRDARGIKATAAHNLGCTRQTIDNYIARDPAIAAAYREARDTLLDHAESQLIAKVDQGEWPAIRFILVTLGKDRGYSERTEFQTFTAGDTQAQRDLQAALDKVYGAPHRAADTTISQEEDNGDAT